jgi:hypothetical protein
MPFMVIYSTSDGTSQHERADAIDEAALVVERLRNQDGIEEVRMYRMEEISFAFRPYYKVELGMPERQGTIPPPEVPSTDAAPVTTDAPPLARPAEVATPGPLTDGPALLVAAPQGDPHGPNGRRGIFGR